MNVLHCPCKGFLAVFREKPWSKILSLCIFLLKARSVNKLLAGEIAKLKMQANLGLDVDLPAFAAASGKREAKAVKANAGSTTHCQVCRPKSRM